MNDLLLPHALRETYAHLTTILERRIKNAREAQPLRPDSVDTRFGLQVVRAIEAFVASLEGVPGGREELERRASFLETRCASGSDYDRARRRALESYRGRPTRLSPGERAIRQLRRDVDVTGLLVVRQVRAEIECLLEDSERRLAEPSREAFAAWRQICLAIEQEAEPLAADGCRWLVRVDNAKGQPDAAQDEVDLPVSRWQIILTAVEGMWTWVLHDSLNPDSIRTAGDLAVVLSEGRRPARVWPAALSSPAGHTGLELELALALVDAQGDDPTQAMQRVVARVMVSLRVSQAQVLAMPLAEFVRAASERSPTAGPDETGGRSPANRRKPRGPKKVGYHEQQREAKLAQEWEAARNTGTYKGDFARQAGMSVRELDKLLDRVAARYRRA